MYLSAMLPILPLLVSSAAGLPVRRQEANATNAADLLVLSAHLSMASVLTDEY